MKSDPPESARGILQRVFGYADFRNQQADIIDHVAAGGDALVLMPTGGGKSLCYQIPALMRAGTAVVISPLIALMADQVAALTEAGVRAAALNSSLDAGMAASVERDFANDDLDLLYVAPERVMTPRFQSLLERSRVALFAIDEAHCVSQWGHDFRPEYIELAVLHQKFPAVPRIALTATADSLTQRDIVERLGLESARVFVTSFDRPNIRYIVVEKHEPRTQLLEFMRGSHDGDSGIVYCLSRRKVDETAAWLVTQGIRALPYHAGLETEVRDRHQKAFIDGEGVVMVATIAFGMGIDKPDVRFVAHLDLPRNIEAYYQETGRAGRDGAPAEAWMAYGLADVVQQRRMIDESDADEDFKRVSRAKLDALVGLAEIASCRRVALLAYFGESSGPCGNCDNCLEPPSVVDATEAAQKLLSAALRSGQRFGAGHLIDILRGKATERVVRLGHDRLPTFGVGADWSDRQWRALVRHLVSSGILIADAESFGALKLAAEARPVLKGETTVALREPRAASAPERRKPQAPQGLDPADARGQALFERLRTWRARTARAHGVPAYVIFHDATLAEIARLAPRDLDTLSRISGVGARKLERYGAELLAAAGEESASN